MKKVNFEKTIKKLCLKIANDKDMDKYFGSELFWIDDYESNTSMHVDSMDIVEEDDEIIDLIFEEDGYEMKLSELHLSALNDVYEFLCNWYNIA